MAEKIKVMFKQGTQANFDKLGTANNPEFSKGTFYLTTDTGHLYYANGTAQNSVFNLSSNIHKVENYGVVNVNGTPTARTAEQYLETIAPAGTGIVGDYYYLVPSNMLVYKTQNGNSTSVFKQINPDTRLESTTTALTTSRENTTDPIALNVSIKEDRNEGANEATGQVLFAAGAGITLTNRTATDTAPAQITIESNVVNTDTKYSLTATSTAVSSVTQVNVILNETLNGDTTEVSSITLKGAKGVSLSKDSNNNTITINGTEAINEMTHVLDENGKLITTIAYPNGDSLTATTTIIPKIEYNPITDNNTTTYGASAVFANGTAQLNVYDTDTVDSLINQARGAINAMTYKGSVSAAELATSGANAKIFGKTHNQGDTFRVSETTNSPVSVKVGDLIVCKEADGTTATIDNIDIIPSGNETSLSVTATSGIVKFVDNMLTSANGSDVIGQLQLKASTATSTTAPISITTTYEQMPQSDGEGGTTNVNNPSKPIFTFAHGNATTGTQVTPGATAATGFSLTIPGIESLYKDSNGHITSISLKNYTITPSIIASTEVVGAAATLGYSLGDTGIQDAHTLTLASNNLSVTATANTSTNSVTYTIDLEWGSF